MSRSPSTGRPSTGRPSTGRPSTGRPSTGRPSTGPLSTSAVCGAPKLGRVSAYDAVRGLGSLEETPATGRAPMLHPFHCTAIAGGSRQIDAGTPVVFVLHPGLGGVVEAGAVTPYGAETSDWATS